MSKLSQELKALLYLNQRYARSSFISVIEIADYLEVTTRQARRYMQDLSNITELDIKTRLGRGGGYRLGEPLEKGLCMPENLVLAMSIAMKRNERIEEVLMSLPNYIVTDAVEGDNNIDNQMLDNLEILLRATMEHRSVTFRYEGHDDYLFFVDPYKVYLTNRTYLLYAVSKDEIKHYNCALMKDIKILGGFKVNKATLEHILDSFKRYGVREGTKGTLRVKCKDKTTLLKFDKYFEGKGAIDYDSMTYVVEANDEHELYYPLFRISTQKYEFMDDGFKDRYITYLYNQIRSIKK